jgi:hypothetical protein
MENQGKSNKASRTIPLCGVQGCCPTAEFTTDGVILRDDHEGKMQLTSDEWASFVAKVKSGELS